MKRLVLLALLLTLAFAADVLNAAEEIWECPNCGTNIPASADDVEITCPNCGHHLQWFMCDGCMGEFVIDSEWTSVECPFCGKVHELD